MTEIEPEIKNQKSKPKILFRVLKIAAIIVALFILFLGLSFAYLYTHQDKIKQVITTNLNQQLNTKVSVGSINIDFFSKFPEVSVKFTNVRAEEALPESEQSLFLFKDVFARFSIFDLLGEDYTVRKLSFDNGEANLRVTKTGEINYHFWKDNDSLDDQSNTAIALENVEFNNAKFRYIDEQLDLRVILVIENLEVAGGYKDAIFEATIGGNGTFADLTYADYDLADSVSISTNGNLTVANGSTKINVTELILQNVKLTGQGEVRSGYQEWNAVAENAQLRQWLPLIPKRWRPQINPAIIGGDSHTTIKVVLDDQTREVTALAKLQDASLTMEEHNILLKNTNGQIDFRYAYSNEKTISQLDFQNITAQTKSGNLLLNVKINDLISPKISASGQFNLQIEELFAIARQGLIKDAKGVAKGNFAFQQNFANWEELKTNIFTAPKLKGEIVLEDGELQFANSNIHLKNISAEIGMRNSDLIIDRLFLREEDSEFLIDGWIYNALYFGANRPLATLSVRLQSQYVDLDRILEWELPRLSEEPNSYSDDKTDPLAVNYNVLLDVKRFNLIRFDGLNLTGEVWNEGLKTKGKDIKFDALDGKVSGNFSWSPQQNGFRFWTKGDLQNIDIHQLFNGFENFGQEWLLADNIYGTGDAALETSMDFDANGDFIPSSLKLVTDISIENGRLKGYKPLLSLSDIVERKNLEDVSFSKLENQIVIENEVIIIPQMAINSTALNLLLQGRHSFDQQIDYSIRLALKDVLGNKRKDKKTDLDEWIVEVETQDQPYIWVHVGCTIADPCLSLDRELIKKGVKKEWQQQAVDIKQIFKPDTTSTPKTDPNKGEVIFEWEEEEPDTNKR